MKLFKISLVLLLGVFLVSCKGEQKRKTVSRVAVLPFYNDPTFTPKWLDESKDFPSSFHKIPDFLLINQLGDTITSKTFEDKIYVTDFFFTSCPGICPRMTSNMLVVQTEFENDNEIRFLSHSVTPKHDSVAVLKHYAEAKGVIPGKWHLVTGERKTIYDLGRNAYFVEEDLGQPKGEDDFLHTENFILIDKNKHIRGIYNGLNKTSIAQLIADIKTLKKEG